MELEYTTAGWERGAESWRSVSEQDQLSPPSAPGPSTRFFAVELPAPLAESASSSEEENNAAPAPAGGVRASPPASASAPAPAPVITNGHAPPPPHVSAADGSLPTAPPPPPPLHNQHPVTWENLSSGGARIPGGMNSSSSTTVPTGSITNGVNRAPAAPEKPLHDQSILYIIVFHNFTLHSGSTITRRYAAFSRELPKMTPDTCVPITRSIKMSSLLRHYTSH